MESNIFAWRDGAAGHLAGAIIFVEKFSRIDFREHFANLQNVNSVLGDLHRYWRLYSVVDFAKVSEPHFHPHPPPPMPIVNILQLAKCCGYWHGYTDSYDPKKAQQTSKIYNVSYS